MKKVILILSLVLLSSCGAKKKTSEHKEIDYDFSSVKDTSVNINVQSKFNLDSAEYLRRMFLNLDLEYEGASGDSITITQYGPSGEKLFETKLKGKGKAKLSSGTITEDKETKTNIGSAQDSTFSAGGKLNDRISLNSNEDSTEKIKVGPPGWFIFLVVFILIIIFFVRRASKKLKKHIT